MNKGRSDLNHRRRRKGEFAYPCYPCNPWSTSGEGREGQSAWRWVPGTVRYALCATKIERRL